MVSQSAQAAAGDEPLHVIFLSSSNPFDVHSFSGTIYYMAQALKRRVPEMEALKSSRPAWFQPLQRLVLRLSKGRVDPYYWNALNRLSARRLARRWRGKRVVVIGVVNSALVAELATEVPVINVSDATFELMRGAHEVFWTLETAAARQGEEDERQSITRSVHSSFSSWWAARSAIDHYGARAKDVSVISWGCNFEEVPASEVRSAEMGEECRLLFIGGEWLRKGGDVVCTVADMLVAKGIPVRVDFVGGLPPEDWSPKVWFHYHGYLSKANKEQLAHLRSLMRHADLLFLPTRKDCTPMVFAEANAYGTPALTRDVGGVADVVHDQKNGVVLPESAEPGEFAAIIEALWKSPERYSKLRASARLEYETRLNWDVWAGKISKLISDLATSGRI